MAETGAARGIYVHDFQTNRSEYIMTGTVPSTGAPQGLHWVDWLPDNRTLIWAGSGGLFRTDTQTKQTTTLHKGCQSRVYLSPSVAADGKTIVVERVDYEVKGTPLALYGEHNLVLMDSDGRNERKAAF